MSPNQPDLLPEQYAPASRRTSAFRRTYPHERLQAHSRRRRHPRDGLFKAHGRNPTSKRDSLSRAKKNPTPDKIRKIDSGPGCGSIISKSGAPETGNMKIRQLLAIFDLAIVRIPAKTEAKSRSRFPQIGRFPLLGHQTSDLLLESKFTSGRGDRLPADKPTNAATRTA